MLRIAFVPGALLAVLFVRGEIVGDSGWSLHSSADMVGLLGIH